MASKTVMGQRAQLKSMHNAAATNGSQEESNNATRATNGAQEESNNATRATNGTQEESNGDKTKLYENRKKSSRPGGLPEKQFLPRPSPLTALFSSSDGRALYNVFLVVLIVLLINSFVDNLLAGSMDLGFNFVSWNFGRLLPASLIWSALMLGTWAVHAAFRVWRHCRDKMAAGGRRPWDLAFLLAYVAYQLSLFYVTPLVTIRCGLPPVTTVVVLCEQVRFVMKSHAFVRSSVPLPRTPIPFAHFVYFLFAPTLVYRAAYPRTPAPRRWKLVVGSFAEVLAVIFYVCHLLERYVLPPHRQYNLGEPATHAQRASLTFSAMLPSMLSYVLLFYCILHSWLNAWAELTRFADRLFYEDWWAARGHGEFYRRWNVVVHDWLYEYVYKDVHACLGGRGWRVVPTTAVFLLSAIVHEYLLAFAFGFFCPAMLVMFASLGTSMTLVTTLKGRTAGNVLLWLMLTTGTGFMVSIYCMEWFSRVNCAHSGDGFVQEYIVPRMLTCQPRRGQ